MATLNEEDNPKQSIGVKKVPYDCIPATVESGIANALLSGALKYGRHNYRACGARASTYYSAARRHLAKWWDEGADHDEDTGDLVHHIDMAIAGLVVLRDAMICGKWTDDRPPKAPKGYTDQMSAVAAQLIDRCENPAAPFTEAEQAPETEPELEWKTIGEHGPPPDGFTVEWLCGDQAGLIENYRHGTRPWISNPQIRYRVIS